MAKKSISGVAGIFLTEGKVVNAARKVREAGYSKLEAISPYPIHAMEEACAIKRSPIPYMTFLAGIVGMLVALALTYYTSVIDWPINIGGKPLFSLPAFIPIIFELTILFAALSSVGLFLYLCGMPAIGVPPIDKDLTCNKFAIFVPDTDKNYNFETLDRMFKDLGAVEVKKVTEF